MHSTTETKAAKVKRLLFRRQGASIEQICAATNWQLHSVRAFLTGLRKKGHTIVREQDGSGVTCYRIAKRELQLAEAAA